MMAKGGSQPRDAQCIFCKIVGGEIPCHKLYEDDDVLAFLDVGPLSQGHTLVIPKGHWVTLDEVPAAVAAGIGGLLPRLSRAVARAAGATAWNILQNNGRAAHQVVQHVHFHIIPKFADSGLGIGWPAGSLDQSMAGPLVQAIHAELDD
jgi:histidine triad (HIT) family protein